MEDYNLYFKRQIELLGDERQKLLGKKSILIIGCGGLGSSLAYALGSVGISHISLVDFDKVEIHNIHRQIAFREKDNGRFKANVVKEVITSRGKYTDVEVSLDKFDSSFSKDKKFDLIMDATDNLNTRHEISKYANSSKTPWLYTSVEEFHSQICLFKEKTFEDYLKITNHKPKGIATPIVMMAASIQANLAFRYLCELNVKTDLLYYIYFDDELNIKKFNI